MTVTSGSRRSVRVKGLYQVIDRRAGQYRPPLLSVSIHKGVIRRDSVTDDLPRAEDLSNYKLCAPGDLVLNRMRAFQGAVGVCKEEGLASPDYLVLRPHRDVEARFLHHLFRSSWFVGEMTARLRGIGSIEQGNVRTPRINPDDFGEIRIDLPSLDEQQRIADFLDAETACLNKLQNAREAQSSLLSEHERACLDEAFDNSRSSSATRLKHLLRVRPRYGVLVPEIVDEGIPFIRVNDLYYLDNEPDRLRKIPASLSAKYPRTVVHPGDLLVSVVGTLGRAAVAPKNLAGANIARAVCCLRVSEGVDVELVRAWLGTSSFQQQARLATSTDTAQPTLGMEDLSNFHLLWPTTQPAQQGILAEIKAMQRSLTILRHRLAQQQTALAERRQALITAAVTGSIDASTASGRGVIT